MSFASSDTRVSSPAAFDHVISAPAGWVPSPESCKNIRVLTSPEPAVGVIITLHSVVTGVVPFKVIVPLVLLAFGASANPAAVSSPAIARATCFNAKVTFLFVLSPVIVR